MSLLIAAARRGDAHAVQKLPSQTRTCRTTKAKDAEASEGGVRAELWQQSIARYHHLQSPEYVTLGAFADGQRAAREHNVAGAVLHLPAGATLGEVVRLAATRHNSDFVCALIAAHTNCLFH